MQAHGDEQALPQGAEHEYRGDEQQRPHRAPVRHAEQGHGGQRAQAHAEHAHAVIGDELAEQHLPAAHGRGQHGLHGAALPLAGKDQRGQQGTDERHDDRDGSGYQKALALGRGIVPVALLYAHRAGLRHPARLPGLLPAQQYGLRIALDEAGHVGLGTVHDELHVRRRAPVQLGVELLAQHQDALHGGFAHQALALAHMADGTDDEVRRMGKVRQQGPRMLAAALVEHGQLQYARVQGDAVAEEQQEQQGQHTGHQIGRGVPHDLLELLAHQGQQLPHPEAA